MIELKTGNLYRKACFGITFPRTLRAKTVVEWEIFRFYTLGWEGGKDDIDKDGSIIVETKPTNELAPCGERRHEGRRVFVRNKSGEEFEYKGIAKYLERYNESQDKIVF
jgi:hypothetical protein